MRTREFADRTGETTDLTSGEGYQCCFRGRGIEPKPPDICTLLLRTAYQENNDGPSQYFFCHAACLKQRLAPGIPTLLEAM